MMVQSGDKVRLLTDIRSNKSVVVFGKAGDVVDVISVAHFPVLIVANRIETFSVHYDNCEKLITR